MNENVSGCFFLNTVYIQLGHRPIGACPWASVLRDSIDAGYIQFGPSG